MSRPRSTDKHQPLTISVPGSLMTRLDQELSYKQSRSKWVQQAIRAKLDAYDNESQIIQDISDLRLLTILHNREVISYVQYIAIKSTMSNDSS